MFPSLTKVPTTSSSNMSDPVDSTQLKIQCFVPAETKIFLQSIHPKVGWIQQACVSFLNSLVHDCKTNGTIHYSPTSAAELNKYIRQRTDTRPTPGGHEQNERGAASGVYSSLSDSSNKPTNLPQSPQGRVGGVGGARNHGVEKGKGQKGTVR